MRLEEAEKRDHRKLGRELDLFHMQEEGKGMVFWHPKGLTLWRVVENYVRRRLDEADYIEVRTPQVLDRKFWEQSGHWDKYRDNMFIAETAEDETLSLKPMNCPGHVQIFKQGQKSYRDLPMRMAEFGACHRYEPSGSPNPSTPTSALRRITSTSPRAPKRARARTSSGTRPRRRCCPRPAPPASSR
jgi:threonyl-tRNA synthetase